MRGLREAGLMVLQILIHEGKGGWKERKRNLTLKPVWFSRGLGGTLSEDENGFYQNRNKEGVGRKVRLE